MVLGSADGRTEHADVVVGTDGIRSTVRRWVVGDRHRGRAVLLGDAAHGMLPHQGQGADTIVEDAFTLAALLAEVPDTLDLPAALAAYQALRRGRTRRIQRLP